MRIKIDDKIYRLREIESGVDSLMELVEEPRCKHGDFLMTRNRVAFIFDRDGENGEAYFLFATDMDGIIKDDIQEGGVGIRYCGRLKDALVADQKATEAIIKGLKEIGKQWDADKKCIEDIPKRKFKAEDKVKIKDGISSETHRGVGPSFVDTMDKFIGKELTVKEYSRLGWVVFYGDDYGYQFSEDWLEPWSDEPKVGDMVIAWNYDTSLAVIGIKIDANQAQACKHVLNNNNSYKHAIKFDGTKEHLEKVRKG